MCRIIKTSGGAGYDIWHMTDTDWSKSMSSSYQMTVFNVLVVASL